MEERIRAMCSADLATPDARSEFPEWVRSIEGILEELNEGVVIVDSQLRVVFANEALLRLIRAGRQELQGMAPDAIFPPQDIPHILRQHEIRHRNGSDRSEFYLPSKDGEKIPAIFSGRSIHGPDGQEYVLLVVTDISVQKRVEDQLRESNILLEKRHKQIEADLSLAARVQQSLAPRKLVWNDLAVETYYKPARRIGGDLGVVFPHADEALTVLICDVSGHGIGSALMANRIYSEALHELELKSSTGNLLRHLHGFVRDRLTIDTFYLTIAAVRFTNRGHRATFAGAGHPPVMLVRNADVQLLACQSGILGCLEEIGPSNSEDEIELTAGDRLVLYTDGLIEVFNCRDELLGVNGLQTLVLEYANRPLPEMKQAILDGVRTWSQGPLTDDVSLIVVEVR